MFTRGLKEGMSPSGRIVFSVVARFLRPLPTRVRRVCEGPRESRRRNEDHLMIALVILALVLCAIGLGTGMAIALARAGAHADEELERLLHRRHLGSPITAYSQSYAGLASAQSTISREPSTTVPSSRRSVGTQRFPVSSFTSRRPRVRLNT